MASVRKALGPGPRGPRITLPFAMLSISCIAKNSPTYANRVGGAFLSVEIRFGLVANGEGTAKARGNGAANVRK